MHCQDKTFFITLVLFFIFVFNAQAQTIVPDSLLFQDWEEREIKYHSYPWTPGCDSVCCDIVFHHEKYYFNLDTFFNKIITHEPEELVDEIRYFTLLLYMTQGEKKGMIRQRLLDAVNKTKNKALERELDILNTYYYFYKDRHQWTEETLDFYKKMILKYEEQGDIQTKLRILHNLLYFSSGFPTVELSQRLQKGGIPVIRYINESLELLEQMDEPYLLGSNSFYTHIGLIYYDFKYYEKAIPLLWKSLEQKTAHYYDRGIMRARDYLGDYYRMKGNYDLSDSLYLSILKDPERFAMRPIDNVVAIGGIAANANLRGHKDEAIRLYSIALPQALEVRDSTLAGGYAVKLGRLFMERGELDKTKEMIRSARQYLIAGNLPFRNWEQFYTLNRDYYLKINNSEAAKECIDSLADIMDQQENIYNSRVLAYAEQEAYENERIQKEEQARQQNDRLLFLRVVLTLIIGLLVLLFYYYKKLQDKNHKLFLQIKNQESEADKQERLWHQYELIANTLAETSRDETESKPQGFSADIRQRDLFARLRNYLLQDHNFANPEITTSKLITHLSTNRTYLFDAIKTFTGKTLQEYINYLRLEEAKHLLETTDEVIDSIATTCGYPSPRTFYRLFRTHFNLSPSAYRRIAREQKILSEEKEKEVV